MRFKLVRTGRTYGEPKDSITTPVAGETIGITGKELVPPVIWETGNIEQIRSLLVLREAELILAKAQLIGNDSVDWWAKNRILDLDMKIADLRRWLAEAVEKIEGK